MKAKLSPNALVGKFFHSINADGYIHWQGRVIGNPEPGWYLLELFDWIIGSPSNMCLAQIADLKDWLFYANDEDMRYSYDYGTAFTKRSPTSREVALEDEAETESDAVRGAQDTPNP